MLDVLLARRAGKAAVDISAKPVPIVKAKSFELNTISVPGDLIENQGAQGMACFGKWTKFRVRELRLASAGASRHKARDFRSLE